jgi:putative transposase
MRTARLHVPGIVHHLIWRFVDRSWYFGDEVERARYHDWLGRALGDSDWRCIAYALMSNHIHLAVVAGREPLASWSRRVNAPFATWMNQQRNRLGPLFADRARDFLVAPERTALLLAYIHNNPVRAGVVDSPSGCRWTSHRAYLALESAPSWLHVDEGLERAGFASSADFDSYVRGEARDIKPADLHAVAHIARKRGSVWAATPHEHVVPLVARPFARLRPDPTRVIELVCAFESVRLDEVRSRRRNPKLLAARCAVVHAGRMLGLTGSDLGAALGVSEQAVSRIARKTRAPSELCHRVIAQLADELANASL